jgi:hypothetical protein
MAALFSFRRWSTAAACVGLVSITDALQTTPAQAGGPVMLAQQGATGDSRAPEQPPPETRTEPKKEQPAKQEQPARQERPSKREQERERTRSTRHSEPEERGSRGGCRSIVGTWSSWASGQFGPRDTRFNADGSITHPTSSGVWSCQNGEYVHDWKLFGRRGPYRLSPDGHKLIKLQDGSVSYSR